MTNMVGTGVGTDQLRILEPLSTLSQCGSDDCQNLNPFGLCVMWIESYTNADAAQAPADAAKHGGHR